MSGPKLSQAEIEAQRRQQLAKQREEYIRRMAALNQKKSDCLGWLSSAAFQKLMAENPGQAKHLRTVLENGIAQITDLPTPEMGTLNNYLSILQQQEQNVLQQIDKLQSLTQQEDQRIRVGMAAQNKIDAMGRIQLAIAGIKQDVPVQSVIVSFDFQGDIQNLRAQISLLVQQMQSDPGSQIQNISVFVKKASVVLTQCANDLALASKKDQVRLQMEQILNEWQELLRQNRRAAELYQQYTVLCSILGKNPNPASAFHTLKTLEDETATLKAAYQKKDEMDYIATQLNTVMMELGYQYVTSQVLKRADGSEYDYSLYQADQEAGISIFTDESGAVMMQMTSLGDGAVTPQDEEESYQRQLDFCASHPDIVQALQEKGVFLKKINYAPPSKKYVRKQQVHQQTGKQVVDRRRRRRNGKKMRTMQ